MIRIEGEEINTVRSYFDAAAETAKRATCLKARCGSVIVAADGEIIGRGYNAPPLGDESQRQCEAVYDVNKKPKYDKTCCVHAEWNAVIDASQSHPGKIPGSTLYFMRIDDAGGFTNAGDPYCTVCSRLTMQSGVEKFALWNDDGFDLYELDEYNALSFQYHKA